MEPINHFLLRELKHLIDKGEDAFTFQNGDFFHVVRCRGGYEVTTMDSSHTYTTFEQVLYAVDEDIVVGEPITQEDRANFAYWEIIIEHADPCVCDDCEGTKATDKRLKEQVRQKDEQMAAWQKLKDEYQSRKG